VVAIEVDPNDERMARDINRPSPNPENNVGLRKLHVGRLTDTAKAVARIGIRNGAVGVYCEQCAAWTGRDEDGIYEYWNCPRCKRRFEIEFAIYEEIE